MRCNIGKFLLVAGFTVVLGTVWGCKTTPDGVTGLPEPSFSQTGMEISDRTVNSFLATVEATIENPREMPLVLQGLTYRVSVRGNQLEEGSHDLSLTVPAGGESTFYVPVEIEHALNMDMFQALYEAAAVNVVFNGVISGAYGSESVDLQLDRAGRMRSLRLPAVSLGTADGARRGLDEIHATFRLSVRNDNPFEVRLSGLDYVLEVEGNTLTGDTTGANQRVFPSSSYVFDMEYDLDTENVPGLAEMMQETNKLSYRIHGSVRIGDIELPFDESDDMRFPQVRMIEE